MATVRGREFGDNGIFERSIMLEKAFPTGRAGRAEMSPDREGKAKSSSIIQTSSSRRDPSAALHTIT